MESRLSVLLFETSAGGVSETAFHWLKRRIDPHQSNRSRATSNLVHKSVEPLFFGVLNERPSKRTQQVRNVRFYTDVPYLNGGLFRPTVNDERGFSDREFDVYMSLCG